MDWLVTNLPEEGYLTFDRVITHIPLDGHQPSSQWSTTIPRIITLYPKDYLQYIHFENKIHACMPGESFTAYSSATPV